MPEIKIYPNPANNFLNINIDDKYQSAKCNIYDNRGALINTFKMSKNRMIDIQGLTQGYYCIEIITDNRQYKGSFIKN